MGEERGEVGGVSGGRYNGRLSRLPVVGPPQQRLRRTGMDTVDAVHESSRTE